VVGNILLVTIYTKYTALDAFHCTIYIKIHYYGITY